MNPRIRSTTSTGGPGAESDPPAEAPGMELLPQRRVLLSRLAAPHRGPSSELPPSVLRAKCSAISSLVVSHTSGRHAMYSSAWSRYLCPERLADDEWVQAEGHHPAAVRRVGIQLVELVPNDLHELRTARASADKQRDVVDLDRVRHAQHPRHVQPVRLVIVAPVEHVAQPQLRQQRRCLERLGQRRTEPALRPSPVAFSIVPTTSVR